MSYEILARIFDRHFNVVTLVIDWTEIPSLWGPSNSLTSKSPLLHLPEGYFFGGMMFCLFSGHFLLISFSFLCFSAALLVYSFCSFPASPSPLFGFSASLLLHFSVLCCFPHFCNSSSHAKINTNTNTPEFKRTQNQPSKNEATLSNLQKKQQHKNGTLTPNKP